LAHHGQASWSVSLSPLVVYCTVMTLEPLAVFRRWSVLTASYHFDSTNQSNTCSAIGKTSSAQATEMATVISLLPRHSCLALCPSCQLAHFLARSCRHSSATRLVVGSVFYSHAGCSTLVSSCRRYPPRFLSSWLADSLLDLVSVSSLL